MVQEMYANYAALPDEKEIADIAYQALLHMDFNVMSDKQVQTLLRAVKHPFLSGQNLAQKRKELTKEVDLKYELKVSADGLSASANAYTILTELGGKWLKDEGVDAEKKLMQGFPHPTSQEGIFPVLISRCGEELEELKQSAGELLAYLEQLENSGWTSPDTGRHYKVKLFITGDMKWLLACTGHKAASSDNSCFLYTCHSDNRAYLEVEWSGV
eukprot:g48880.t1